MSVVPTPRESNSMDYGNNGDAFAEATGLEPVVDWPVLVDSIRIGQPEGMELLYRLFEHGVRLYLVRRLGQQELDDKVHDVFLIVVEAIQKGELREPERLMGFVRTIVRRQVAAHITEVVQNRHGDGDGSGVRDHHTTPEEDLMGVEQSQLMWRILGAMSARDREILDRFYLREESQQVICEEMNLTDTQFRLLKSRAKQRFGELGRRRLENRQAATPKVRNIFMRTFDRFRH